MSLGYVCRIDVGGLNLRLDNWEASGQSDPEQVGGVSRAYAGNQYSSVIEEFMVVPLVSGPISTAEYKAVDDAFAKGAQLGCDGDCFKGRTDVITCSGKVTAQMVPGGIDDNNEPLWIVNLTLTEVGDGILGTPLLSYFLLTSVDSPDSTDPDTFVSTPDGSYPGDASLGWTLLSGASVGVGGGVNPTTPDISWLSVPLNAAMVYGRPYVRLETAMSGVYSGTTVWAIMDMMAKIYQVRDDGAGGFDIIAGPFSTNYVGVGLGGGIAILTSLTSVVLSLETNDRFLVEIYPRLQLQPLTADNGQRQVISYGAVPGPRQNPILGVGGLVTSA